VVFEVIGQTWWLFYGYGGATIIILFSVVSAVIDPDSILVFVPFCSSLHGGGDGGVGLVA
jgi:hypothetical protein